MLFTVIIAYSLVTTVRSGYEAEERNVWQRSSYSGQSFRGDTNHLSDSYGNPSQNTNYYGHSAGLFNDHTTLGNNGHVANANTHYSREDDWQQHNHHVQVHPVSQHIEVTKPVAVPVVKNIGIPVAQPVPIQVPHPVTVGVPQPYPVHIPVPQPVAIPVIKTIVVPVEKRVPYPIEKIIPVSVEKPVPVTVEKHIPVPVEKPYPIHIPVYKHVFHRLKGHGGGHSGHGRRYSYGHGHQRG